MKINWQTEPAAIIGLTKALLEVGAGLGLSISDQKSAAIVSGVAAVLTLLATFFARSKVSSPATAQALRQGTILAANGVAGYGNNDELLTAPNASANIMRSHPGLSVSVSGSTAIAAASGLHAHDRFKLGLKPHGKPDDQLLAVGWAAGKIPAYEPAVDRISSITIGMDGNDQYGDCGPAACDNHRRIVSKTLLGDEQDATETQVLRLYSDSTQPPFNPITGANDVGVDMATLMDALKKKGLAGRKIVAYGRLKDTSDESVYAAIDLFGAVLFAVDLQQAQQDQSSAVSPVWDFVPSPDWGGHAVVAGGYNAKTGIVTVGSWGMAVGTTRKFRAEQLAEVWVPIWPELLSDRRFVTSVDVQALAAEFQVLTGGVLPLPTPVPVPVPPVPAPPQPEDFLAAVDLFPGLHRRLDANRLRHKDPETGEPVSMVMYSAWVLAGDFNCRTAGMPHWTVPGR